MMTLKLAPELGKLVNLIGEAAFMRGKINRVDGTGRHASDDLKLEIGKMPGQTFEQADLIGCPRAAAREHHREVAGFRPFRGRNEVKVGDSHSLIHFKAHASV